MHRVMGSTYEDNKNNNREGNNIKHIAIQLTKTISHKIVFKWNFNKLNKIQIQPRTVSWCCHFICCFVLYLSPSTEHTFLRFDVYITACVCDCLRSRFIPSRFIWSKRILSFVFVRKRYFSLLFRFEYHEQTKGETNKKIELEFHTEVSSSEALSRWLFAAHSLDEQNKN